MKKVLRLRIVVLPVLVVALVMAGPSLYLLLAHGRPLCLPRLSLPDRELTPAQATSTVPADLPIPEPGAWVDYGPILEAGAEGEWDRQFAGLTPASVVKKNGTIYFYYVAADGHRSFDGGPRHRSVGVATSPDGIRFQKYGENPVMTHRPYDGEEEGANSAGVTLDEDGRFFMVYGAAKGPGNSIVADARFADSDDGLTFEDAGQALDHCDLSLYGFGDEIFPIAVLRQDDRWVVYYQPNGNRNTERTLGAAWGRELDRLHNSTMVLDEESGGLPVDTWGNVITLDEETLVFFIQRLWWPDTFVEVRVASPETPYALSEPLVRYDIPDLKRGVAFLDKERRTWFLYYNDFSRFWYVKLAPHGPVDATPPTAPTGLMGSTPAHDRARLSWGAAADNDTGIVEYRVYRNGEFLNSTRDTIWTDGDLAELTPYTYEVTAVNFHGLESQATATSVTTPASDETSRRLDDPGRRHETFR